MTGVYSPQLPGVRFEGLHAVTPTSVVFSSGEGVLDQNRDRMSDRGMRKVRSCAGDK
jgi:hypothetical protein